MVHAALYVVRAALYLQPCVWYMQPCVLYILLKLPTGTVYHETG